MVRGGGLPLRSVRPDIALPGGATRSDYASINPQRHFLFIAHRGADRVIAVDLTSGRGLDVDVF